MPPLNKKKPLPKCPTGIQGFDEITGGGLPKGRSTLVCGSAGCGKTMFGIEFLVRGVTQYAEPGVFMSFEETADELSQNVSSLGWDLEHLIAERKLSIDCVYIDPTEIQESGEYDLEGVFIRLSNAIDAIKAKRVVLDTVEVLFSGLSNDSIVRAELRRLFRWLKSKGVTTIITGERGEKTLTRQGLEEYVADCVIRLDQRIDHEMSTRRLQVLKYRGSNHETNEYPFLIGEDGLSVLPITSIELNHEVSTERVSSGLPRLDTMLGEQGYFRGSSILVTGTAGTGKSTISAHFAATTCQQGERCLYLAFEESAQQIMRNMRSVGLDLAPYVQQNLLRIEAMRPTTCSLELHLVKLHNWLSSFMPHAVIIDPISNLILSGSLTQAKGFFMRLIDFLKSQHVTVLMTSLTPGGSPFEHTDVGVSSLMDTWIELRVIENNGERNRIIQILKSRGMAHSNQVREFLLSGEGVELVDVYLGQGHVLTGTARLAQEAQEKLEHLNRQQKLARMQRELERQQLVVQAQIAALQAQLEGEREEINYMLQEEEQHQMMLKREQVSMAHLRRAD